VTVLRLCSLAVLLRVLLGSSVVSHPSASAQPVPAHLATTTWHGLALTLRLSAGDLPKDALVRATVSLTNRSRWAREVLYGGCDQADGTLSPRVLLADGTVAPLPAVLWPPVSCGPAPLPATLLPGQTLARRLYLILTGEIVQGSVRIGGYGSGHLMKVRVRPHLEGELPPEVRLHATSPTYATIQPLTHVHGPLLFAGWLACDTDSRGTIQGTRWTRTSGDRLTPRVGDGCPAWEWHVVAGWLHHPVAVLDYKSGTPPAANL
jgi:hypothetical protein